MRQRLFILAVALSVGVMAAVAGALWSASGTGTGAVTSTSALSVSVNASVGTGDLFPGFLGGDISFTLTNPNPYAVTFTDMTAGTVTSLSPTACPASNVAVANASGLSINVAANSTSGVITIPDIASMISLAPNGCQGVSFNVAVTLTGSQT